MAVNQFLPAGIGQLSGWLTAAGAAGAGAEDDGQYHIMEGNATIEGATLNDLTSAAGIGFLHTGPGFTGVLGSSTTPFQPKYNATTSASKTKPGLVLGGKCTAWFDPVTNACGRVRVYPGATLHLVGETGVCPIIEILPTGSVVRWTAGFDAQKVWCMGNWTDMIDATNDFDEFYAEGPAVVKARCQAAVGALYPITDGYGRVLGEPTVYVNHPNGWASVTKYGGRIIAIKGAIPTIVDKGGAWDLSQVVNPMALGASAYGRWPFAGAMTVQASSPVTITAPTDEMGGPIQAFATPGSLPGG